MSEELDNTAVEYVLGTLPADERARFAERLRTDSALRGEVSRLQARLSPLDEAAPPETPRGEIWREIERQTLGDATASNDNETANVVALRRRVSAWRGATLIAGALAAGLAAIVVLDRTAVPTIEGTGRYVAVVNSDGHEPALIAEVDTISGVIRVRSLQARTPPGKSLELWHVEEGKAPRSLGILNAGLDLQTIQNAGSPVNGVLAVSVEPEGGSPSGQPTGDIVYTGKLIPVE